MSREIRRVPKGWEHPKDEHGDYIPLYDADYQTTAQEWLEACIAWSKGEHPDQKKHPSVSEYKYYWEYDNPPPDPKSYRPKWDEGPTCYQIYETVTEGTPVSPVFESDEELVAWLITQGYSEKEARSFAKHSFAPSMTIIDGTAYKNIEVGKVLA